MSCVFWHKLESTIRFRLSVRNSRVGWGGWCGRGGRGKRVANPEMHGKMQLVSDDGWFMDVFAVSCGESFLPRLAWSKTLHSYATVPFQKPKPLSNFDEICKLLFVLSV